MIDPLAVCEWCKQPTADVHADCERDECRELAATSERDRLIAAAVAEELDEPTFEEIATEKRSADL